LMPVLEARHINAFESNFNNLLGSWGPVLGGPGVSSQGVLSQGVLESDSDSAEISIQGELLFICCLISNVCLYVVAHTLGTNPQFLST
jgi:hypothetical protein